MRTGSRLGRWPGCLPVSCCLESSSGGVWSGVANAASDAMEGASEASNAAAAPIPAGSAAAVNTTATLSRRARRQAVDRVLIFTSIPESQVLWQLGSQPCIRVDFTRDPYAARAVLVVIVENCGGWHAQR